MSNGSKKIILASASPRRLEILRAHGIEPKVVIPKIDERGLLASLLPELSPTELVQQLASLKARDVYEQVSSEPPDAYGVLILAADTIVYKEELGVLGKPTDRADAIRMLLALCNTEHEVITGVSLIEGSTGEEWCLVDITTVHFGEYGLTEIEEYLASEPPFDKAGSYAIQGMWGRYVTQVEGDFENVIGLPFYRLESYKSPNLFP